MARTTNYAKATYTEIIDLQTVNGKCSIIGIHTPTGNGPYSKLRGFFTQFRKFKYLGIDRMIMCPAANLPVDPLGLTGVQGTTDLMDPRDTLNPILFHGCHGESMSDVINSLFGKHASNTIVDGLTNPSVGYESQSADMGNYPFTQFNYPEVSYYRFLTDPKWRKFGTQSMVNIRRLHPLTWKVASTTPYLPGGNTAVGIVGGPTANTAYAVDQPPAPFNILPNVFDFPQGEDVVGSRVRMFSQQFTNGVAPLGWLPTTVSIPEGSGSGSSAAVTTAITKLPKLFMGVLVLPPAYNVEQFFRLSIRHTFLFKDFTQSLFPLFGSVSGTDADDSLPVAESYFNWIDYTEDGTSKEVKMISPIDNGTTLDVLDGKSEVISDSAM